MSYPVESFWNTWCKLVVMVGSGRVMPQPRLDWPPVPLGFQFSVRMMAVSSMIAYFG